MNPGYLEVIAELVVADVVVVGEFYNEVRVLGSIPHHGLAPPEQHIVILISL